MSLNNSLFAYGFGMRGHRENTECLPTFRQILESYLLFICIWSGKLLLVLASTVILVFWSRRLNDHIFLSHDYGNLATVNLGRGARNYISSFEGSQSGPVRPSGRGDAYDRN
jgi:hypothetical protein